MKKNLKGLIEQFPSGEAQILIDMNQYDMIEGSGMAPDLVHKKSAHMTAAWRFAQKSRVSIPVGRGDLSAHRFLTFSVFAVSGMGGSFCLMFDSDVNGAGKNGYECTLPITRDGWNDYRVELPFLRAVGEPTGWDRIGSICFDCVAGGQANRTETVLYIDNLFVWDGIAPPLYATMPELKGAAVFSKSGNFSIVDRKRIANSIDGEDTKPFERDGVLWLPMAPVAAGIAHSAVVDNRAFTLSFTYRRKKYFFSGDSDRMTVNGEEEALGFYPAVLGGTLFFPAEFVKNFFRWRQCFIDASMGLVVLSNRRNVFESARDEAVIWQLVADTTFLRPSAERVLNDLHRRFPNPSRGRLLATFDELMQLRRDAKTDSQLKGYVEDLKTQYGVKSEAFLTSPITLEVDASALKVCSEKLIAFSMLYRVTGDKVYAERSAAECEALAAMEDWSLGSMTNIGTVALSVAIAYDWCHHIWSEGRKAVIERAMLRSAMRPGVEAYDGKRRMWRTGSANGAAINAGMLAMALALADIYPQTAYKLLDRVLRNVEPCFAAYAPDGGYPEGVAAWEKSTRALALTVAMLQKACGDDYGFASAPGFLSTAYFPIHAETKNGSWNYHNCAATPVDTSFAFFFTRLTDDPVPAWMRRQQLLSGKKNEHPFDILFYVPVSDQLVPYLPLDAVYRKAGLAMMRSGWNDDAAFVGLHGGKNHEVGGDLDAGSVILDMGGERFFVEIGGDENLPLLLRKRAAGQNTLTVEPAPEPAPDQNPDAIAKLTEMRSSPARAYAVVDMSSVSDAILRGKRGVLLTEQRSVAVIQDELTLTHAAEVVWTAWTRAEVTLNKSGRTAKLTQNSKTLVCKLCGIASPARFETKQIEGSDLTCLTVHVTGKDKLRMAVVCRMLGEGESASQKMYDVIPMSRWCETEA
ncbi:MAG: hypothetical protein IJW55_00035 [Clostridia bacterium]|nr:hypothetical protein [Clostridia bacterium]